MAQLTDTNLLHRGGEAGLHLVQREARRILELPLNRLEEALQALDMYRFLFQASRISQALGPSDSGTHRTAVEGYLS